MAKKEKCIEKKDKIKKKKIKKETRFTIMTLRIRKSVELRMTKKRIKRIETKLRQGNRVLKSQKKKLTKLKRQKGKKGWN